MIIIIYDIFFNIIIQYYHFSLICYSVCYFTLFSLVYRVFGHNFFKLDFQEIGL